VSLRGRQPAARASADGPASSPKAISRRIRSGGRSRTLYHSPARERRSHERGTSTSSVTTAFDAAAVALDRVDGRPRGLARRVQPDDGELALRLAAEQAAPLDAGQVPAQSGMSE
jgi:hypothetical protein